MQKGQDWNGGELFDIYEQMKCRTTRRSLLLAREGQPLALFLPRGSGRSLGCFSTGQAATLDAGSTRTVHVWSASSSFVTLFRFWNKWNTRPPTGCALPRLPPSCVWMGEAVAANQQGGLSPWRCGKVGWSCGVTLLEDCNRWEQELRTGEESGTSDLCSFTPRSVEFKEYTYQSLIQSQETKLLKWQHYCEFSYWPKSQNIN